MKTKLIILWTLTLGFGSVARAQDNLPQIVGSTANYTQVGAYLFDYSVGEMTVVETFKLPDGSLTQGFLQPLVGVKGEGLPIIVFPDMSPNGDDKGREMLTIQDIENYPVNDIEIFNRWGNIIFKINGYDNAEHSFKGKANTGLLVDDAEAPDGTYYYILKVLNPTSGKVEIFRGFFVLKRK